MAKKSSRSSRSRQATQPSTELSPASEAASVDETLDRSHGLEESVDPEAFSGATGQLIATIPAGDSDAISAALGHMGVRSGLTNVCRSSDFGDHFDMDQAGDAEVFVFDEFDGLAIAFIKGAADQQGLAAASAREQGLVVEPAYWNHALGMLASDLDDPPESVESPPDGERDSIEYLRGYRDALIRSISALEGRTGGSDFGPSTANATFANSASATWGLQATGVVDSTYTGAGVKVAVLDTGFHSAHPDFARRQMVTESFIPAYVRDRFGRVYRVSDTSATRDRSGHGTHCIGTACGPLNPGSGPRYGVAHGAEIHSGKVLAILPGSNRASGSDEWILAGMRWAIRQRCTIISMSLGSPVLRGQSYPTYYEELARSALRSGVLIVAAAGNESKRRAFPPTISAVGRPANCPSIVAVAAVDNRLRVAPFSNRQLNGSGGEINFSGPGVAVLSSYRPPYRTNYLSGTSQATPHVAGIAALVQEETGKKGMELYRELRSRALPLGNRVDYGNGLVQARLARHRQ